MTILDALILGIVEGITEFLPISSTGHLLLFERLLALAPTEFLTTFTIVIQLGAILSVIVVYRRELLTDFGLWKKILAAFIPTAILGLLLYKVVKEYLLLSPMVVLWALGLGGFLIILAEWLFAARLKTSGAQARTDITYLEAVIIGLCQALALIPGVSRSAATIIGGLALGVERETIVRFSFLLAVPTMLAASGFDLVKHPEVLSGVDLLPLLVGFVVSFLVAWASIKFLLHFVRKHSFIWFGVYRIVLVLAWLLLFS